MTNVKNTIGSLAKGFTHNLCSKIKALRNNKKFLIICFTALVFVILLFALWQCWLSPNSGGLARLYKIGFILAIALVAGSFFLYRKSIGTHPENVYLVILLTLTLFGSWAYDTNEVCVDLESHYGFALDFADIDGTYELTEADDAIIDRWFDAGFESNDDIKKLEAAKPSGSDALLYGGDICIWTNTDYLQEKDALLNQADNIPDNEGKERVAPFALLYNRIASLPASFILFILSIFGTPFVIKFVLAKFSYAIIYSIVLYLGMCKLTNGKMLYAVISMFPTCIFLASNYGYDYWIICWSMYAIASITGIMQRPNKKVADSDLVKIVLAFIVAMGPKAVYFPLLFLSLFIPRKVFKDVRQYKIFRTSILVASLLILATFALPLLSTSPDLQGDTRGGNENVYPKQQLQFILEHPKTYLITLINHLTGYLSFDFSYSYITYFVAYLGEAPKAALTTITSLLFFTFLTDSGISGYSKKENLIRRVVVVCLFLFIVASVSTALYVYFTPVGYSTIEGVQGRYILPLLFPLFMLLGSRFFALPDRANVKHYYNLMILGILTVVNFYCIWSQYIRLLH